ncbi:MAG: hypothetical protein KIT43_16480 [Bauldia sp.]|nr:hypothetical protein [Bauldia sp.]
MKSVVVLFLSGDNPDKYVVSRLAAYWREEGLTVHFLFGTSRYVPADVLFLHVDLSVVPDRFLHLARRYARTINGRVTDIRKRVYSSLALTRVSSHSGPVIVKTNLNYGGKPERTLHPNYVVRAYHRLRGMGLRFLTGAREGVGYRVYPSMASVPALVWFDPYLLVEKFLPERVDDRYAVRTYHCFGEHESCFLLTSPHPLVKSGPETETHALEPDPRLRTLRLALGLDYGKIDYVLVDDRPVILDVNKTIGLSEHFADDPVVAQARRERARAIHGYFR